MTYRHPYNRKLRPDEFTRPPLPDWLQRGLLYYENKTRSQKHSIDYWVAMYWATPPWLTDKQIQQMKDIYDSRVKNFHHADHIVPINSPIVCGLNVPWNLRRYGAKDNIRKSNNWWPGHPEEHIYSSLGLFDNHDATHQMSLI